MLSQNISSNPNNSVFVSASAGSGKTTVLTNRVLRLLLLGTSPSKILCLTFTKVAANQMQNKILSQLEDWASSDDEKLKNYLENLTSKTITKNEINEARKLFAKLLDDHSGLQISTIHSFCQSIIQKFPIEAKSTPNFSIIDEQKESGLLIEARNKVLQEALDDSALAEKINAISAKLNEESFLDISSELLKKRYDLAFLKEKYFDINGVIDALFKRIGVGRDETEETIFNDFISDYNWQKQEISKLFIDTEIKGFATVKKFVQDPNLADLQEYLRIFLTNENEPRKKIITKAIEQKFGDANDIISSEQSRIVKFLEKLNTIKIATSTASLLVVTNRIIEIYTHLKNQNGYLDYSDLIIKTSELLENSANREWIKYKLDGIYEHILIDESQDTNHQQWSIIKAITEEFFAGIGSSKNQNPTIFIVGDEKQSIYSFQGAEPNIFSNIFYYYQEKLDLVNKKLLNIELNTSFRSFPTILKVVDQTFANPDLKASISALSLHIKHQAFKTHAIGKVELLPIISCPTTKREKDEYDWNLDFSETQELKEREILAKFIADKIKKLFLEGKFLASKQRHIRFGDIMILLKERKSNLENLLIKYLSEAGIPALGAKRISFGKNIIIQDLISCAKFILLPSDDLNLACLLKSAFFDISEEELLRICQIKNDQKISLFAALQQSNERFYSELKNFINQNQLHKFSIQEFFNYVLVYKNKKESILARHGAETEEILNHFFSTIINYQNNNTGTSLEGFVQFLENTEIEIKIDNFDQTQNKIYITTVHSSKGLEAPIVFIADSVHNKKQGGNNKQRIFWDRDSGLPFWSFSADFDNVDIKNIKKYEREIIKKEYWRQLYVAMTRAQEELYVCGYGEKYDENCWYEAIKNAISGEAISLDKSSFGSDFENYLLNDGLVVGSDSNQENTISKTIDDSKINQQKNVFDQSLINKLPDNEHEEIFLYPSELNDKNIDLVNDNAVSLGVVIHKIFEILLKSKINDSEKRVEFIKNYVADKINDQNLINDITNRINAAFKEFGHLLNHPNSKSEVPIIAKIDGKVISGKIDLLIIDENEILVIDFKTGKRNDEKYQGQMDIYKKALRKIYLGREIKSQIIWI